jgi:hypothetical protein
MGKKIGYMSTYYMQTNVSKYVPVIMCATADSLMLTQSVATQMILYIMKVQ